MGGVRAGNLYGTLEVLILRGLDLHGPMHGVGVADHMALRSEGLFQIEEGSLYPALHRLQAKGHVRWEWMKTEGGKRAKFYEITSAVKGYGEKIVHAVMDSIPADWDAFVIMDYSDGFWEKMIEKYDKISIL